MNKFFLSIYFILFSVLSCFSQKPFYHKNKDVAWVGETEFTYYLENYDRLNFEPPTSASEETRTIKLDPYATCEFGNEKYFTNFIISETLAGRREVSSMNGKKLSLTEIENAFGSSTIDTTVIIDPVSGEEKFMVVKTEPRYQINSFKVKQWWFFEKENQSLGSLVRAIAPIVSLEKKDGSVLNKPLFWIKMEQDANTNFHFNDPTVIWAKETLSTLKFDKVKKVKGRTKKTFKNFVWKKPRKGDTQVLENESWYSYCAEELEKEKLDDLLGSSVDTVITFDPETFEEKLEIVKSEKVKYKNIKNYRVLQHWYFDKSSNMLASKVISIGPLLDVKDQNGKFKFRRALYYIPSSQ